MAWYFCRKHTLFQRGKWENDFKGQLFFSHGKTNTCGAVIRYFGTKTFSLLNKSSYANRRILLLEVDFDGNIYVFLIYVFL